MVDERTAAEPSSNTEKDPDDWVSGDEPMTGAQRSYLKTLSEQAKDDAAFADDLTKAEASKRIDHLRETLKL
ncbi:DUF3072 domain-containing protein [Xaviernesmea oryzae]|uniref:DUF3072 domain-containing protein n=1 Tax=Xaviernesmea oryzae TaxID=464029 RepID=A0A1Q9ATA5_9HYPH|nr:DUF3072 domain-containing protein [Xaviernesmea oryzae]OLP58643.1 DUF3072 domain-containing protein [Xaviernesmea oryzae]SEK65431.1 Protein of unknown function [Xaviernesmea oryzae]